MRKPKKPSSLYDLAQKFCINGYRDGYTGNSGNFSRLRSLILANSGSTEIVSSISDFFIASQEEGDLDPINSIFNLMEVSSPYMLYEVLIDLAQKGTFVAPPDTPIGIQNENCNKILLDYWAKTRNQVTAPETPEIIHAIGNFYRAFFMPASIDKLVGFVEVATNCPEKLTALPPEKIPTYLRIAQSDIKYGLSLIQDMHIENIPPEKIHTYKRYASMDLKND